MPLVLIKQNFIQMVLKWLVFFFWKIAKITQFSFKIPVCDTGELQYVAEWIFQAKLFEVHLDSSPPLYKI